MRKLKYRWLRRILIVGWIVCGIDNADRVWTDCAYCKNLNAPIQTCSGIGSSNCGQYYSYAQTVCCSNSGSTSCNDIVSYGSYTAYYQNSYGNYCNGYYLCSGNTSSPCSGDVIGASSSDCTPTGPLYSFTSTKLRCK